MLTLWDQGCTQDKAALERPSPEDQTSREDGREPCQSLRLGVELIGATCLLEASLARLHNVHAHILVERKERYR